MKKYFLPLLFAIGLNVEGNIFSQDHPVKNEQTSETSEDEINALLNEAQVNDTADQKASGDTTMALSTEASSKHESYGIFGTPLTDCGKAEDGLSIWRAFAEGLFFGFLALLFPCTFPMIPMTMSFFLKGGDKAHGKRNAILYGFCIFLVYFLLSLPFHLGLGGDALNNFATNVWVNLIFFIVFIGFAFSLFGYYDISLPSGLANKVDSKSGTGSLAGIFFMAFTLAIVSFSCTGPILGIVLASAKNSKFITPAFSGFGIGLGIPFALFALFPQTLKSLPKSGSWMDVLKTVFGFVELAFAFKFLSNADLVERWGLIKREPFVIVWILIFALMGLYLFGLFKFKKGSSFKKTTLTWGLGLISFLFVGYLATDFFGGELRYLSGFPPPKSYSLLKQKEYFDTHQNKYEEALAKAKSENKLLLLDFTGWACVNCRRMEENVWVHPEVYDLMKNEFVITSLYVDQKTKLSEDKQYYSETLGKKIITEGDKWTEMQAKNLYQFTQPQYAIIDPQSGRIMNHPIGGYNEVSVFKDFLTCALKNNKK